MIGPLAPGDVFAGEFRVVKAIAQGGMGAVYEAEQISTGKTRALKLMHAEMISDPVLRRRFEQEAKVGARIESEHVVEIVGAGVDHATGAPWIAMELLRGEDLRHALERRKAFPRQEARAIFEQLCHALGAAHAAGVVHRDLKPENIFLAEARLAGVQFTVKVLDFGIAKIVADARTMQPTAAMGSPMWMAPEQTERGAITAAVDVWALGLLAFHVLTGRYYWRAAEDHASTMTELLREIILEPLRPASVRAAEAGVKDMLPPGFDGWFAKCVSRDPASRYRDARECFAALSLALTATQAPALPPQAWQHPYPYPYPSPYAPYGAPAWPPPPQAYGPQGFPPPPRKGLGAGAIVGIVLAAVLVPLVAIVAVVATGVSAAERTRKRATAHVELLAIQSEAETYRFLNASKCPSLSDLYSSYRFDPWGNPYSISCTGGRIIVTSAGPDGKLGTSDDQASDTY